ncbi:MAG: Kdo hydroxylase family protein [Steroidobacteraceae bacterium]
MSALVTFTSGQISAGESITEALESNRIVFFPSSPVALPDEATLRYLRTELPARLKLKNISYHPEVGRITGFDGDEVTARRLTLILQEHLAGVSAFLRRQVPHLTEEWTVGTCSVRPIEERGRDLKPHASNELVHVDAGAYGATDGDRILRFFVNFNDREDRVWATQGPIERIVERFGREAGVLDRQGRLVRRLSKGPGDRALSALVHGLAHLNPLAQVLDTSPYDRAMRRLHNYMKDNGAFREDRRDYEEIRFPPYSAWMVFTDGCSHASVSGQFALVTTIIVRRRHMKYPQFAPFNVLMARRNEPLAASPGRGDAGG